MLKKVKNSLKTLVVPVKIYAAAAIAVVIVSAVVIATAGSTPDNAPGNAPGAGVSVGAVNSPVTSMGLTQIYSYEVMYSANTFAPRIWLRNSTAYIGQLIFKPDGAVLPNDNMVNGQVNLYYHLEDFENILYILRNEKPVYLLYSGSGSGFENGIRTYPEPVGEGGLLPYITTTYR